MSHRITAPDSALTPLYCIDALAFQESNLLTKQNLNHKIEISLLDFESWSLSADFGNQNSIKLNMYEV